MDTKLKSVKKKANDTLIKIAVVVFLCMFFIGMGVGIVGSLFLSACLTAVVCIFMNDYLSNRVNEYETILHAVSALTESNFEEIVKADTGVFEPIKDELCKIQNGIRKAVENEVKSERMKAELITNVSHDLKTPLTAITTYVELLKKEDITEEERKSYIETLEKKSARMKVLIEDLFDLSKASSNDVTLDISGVDIVNLMRQVVVEHNEKYEELGLELIWNVPEEKIEVSLDNQKTYRVFENLFLNIEKYAMKNSRVYIDVREVEQDVQIIMRNMSAEPLHISGEQLTERFVRGDKSRNTEGSGLGLAIAKSFVEVQKGTFDVVVDGDLFKTVITWKK